MSASLVGSEMCIRDRSSTPSVLAPLRGPGGGFRRTHAGRQVLHRVGAGAVSYTHLTLPTICSV
eukprot:11853475-Alexandrium_andersonii.AAC.1